MTDIIAKDSIERLNKGLPPAQAWLLCEPVELRAQNTEVVCLGNAHIKLNQAEADAIAATFNAYWEGTGRILYTPTPMQWVLALPNTLSFSTIGLPDAMNKAVNPPDSFWSQLFSEAQMLMQAHPVNRARAGVLPVVNGCWFSGV